MASKRPTQKITMLKRNSKMWTSEKVNERVSENVSERVREKLEKMSVKVSLKRSLKCSERGQSVSLHSSFAPLAVHFAPGVRI